VWGAIILSFLGDGLMMLTLSGGELFLFGHLGPASLSLHDDELHRASEPPSTTSLAVGLDWLKFSDPARFVISATSFRGVQKKKLQLEVSQSDFL